MGEDVGGRPRRGESAEVRRPSASAKCGRSWGASCPWPSRPGLAGRTLAGDDALRASPGPTRVRTPGGDRGQLDACVLQDLLEALDSRPTRASESRVLRYRVSPRSSRTGGGGTKLGRTMPWAATSASHSASERSVLRPGTFLTCRALHSHTRRSAPLERVIRPASNTRRSPPSPRSSTAGFGQPPCQYVQRPVGGSARTASFSCTHALLLGPSRRKHAVTRVAMHIKPGDPVKDLIHLCLLPR